jgi:cytochrome c oxidase assembly protein subunit 15
MARRTRSLAVGPLGYRRVADVALALSTLIVFTGAGVRLTGSGLGCKDWPKCTSDALLPATDIHAWIEYGNRLVTTPVSIAAIAAVVFACRRRPFRRDLLLIALVLPLMVAAQAILGMWVVKHELKPGFVMAHYIVSMLMLVGAVALAWRARHEPGQQPRSTDRVAVWGVRWILAVGAVVTFFGTITTASGPHAGGAGTGDSVARLEWFGIDQLNWAYHSHGRLGTLLGVSTVTVFFLLRRRSADPALTRVVGLVAVLMAVQGAIGLIQYQLKLPSGLVWVHVLLATTLWLTLLWATAQAGRLAPQEQTVAGRERVPASAN